MQIEASLSFKDKILNIYIDKHHVGSVSYGSNYPIDGILDQIYDEICDYRDFECEGCICNQCH